jgi:hypothetical protein
VPYAKKQDKQFRLSCPSCLSGLNFPAGAKLPARAAIAVSSRLPVKAFQVAPVTLDDIQNKPNILLLLLLKHLSNTM